MPLLPVGHPAFVAAAASQKPSSLSSQSLSSLSSLPLATPIMPPPTLLMSVACMDGSLQVKRYSQKEQKEHLYTIRYRVFRPNNLRRRRPPPPCLENSSSISRSSSNNNNNNNNNNSSNNSSRSSRNHHSIPVLLPPLVVLHGGPSVPCDYLYPLVDVVPNRSIVFYDQLGCGRSCIPQNLDEYSIDLAVQDLMCLLQHLNIGSFHLYGQSYGGIIAYEFLKKQQQQQQHRNNQQASITTVTTTTTTTTSASSAPSQTVTLSSSRRANTNATSSNFDCLAVILSSTPWSVPLVEEEAHRLLSIIQEEAEEADPEDVSKWLGEEFRKRHQCRLEEMPLPLRDAYAHAGTVWRGTSVIGNYKATRATTMKQSDRTTSGSSSCSTSSCADVDNDTALQDNISSSSSSLQQLPPCLVMRGQHDFVTQECVQPWIDELWKETSSSSSSCGNANLVVLAGCSHHGLLENAPLYGDVINSFLSQHDPTKRANDHVNDNS